MYTDVNQHYTLNKYAFELSMQAREKKSSATFEFQVEKISVQCGLINIPNLFSACTSILACQFNSQLIFLHLYMYIWISQCC